MVVAEGGKGHNDQVIILAGCSQPLDLCLKRSP